MRDGGQRMIGLLARGGAKRRTAEEIFAAAYMLYARYVNPVTARRCDIHEAIRILAAPAFSE